MVHSHVHQAEEQLMARLRGYTFTLHDQVNTLESYFNDMFGSLSGVEVSNIVQTVIDMKKQIALLTTQYNCTVPPPTLESLMNLFNALSVVPHLGEL